MRRFEPSKEMLAIKAFVSPMPDGAFIRYEDVENATRVPMEVKGKQYLRSALDSLGRSWRCDKGVGIELESPNNSMHIITEKVRRVSSAVKKGHKVTSRLIEHHLEDMNQDDRSRATAVASLLGATMAFAKGLEQAYKPKKLNIVSPPSLSDSPFTK